MPWYSPDDYGRLRDMAADPHAMAAAYETWRASAVNNEQVAKDAGLTVVRVPIDPDVFAAWCAERNRELDSRARMQFASEAAGL
jgi:hypothetical protein